MMFGQEVPTTLLGSLGTVSRDGTLSLARQTVNRVNFR
jgi:hypothetical protein